MNYKRILEGGSDIISITPPVYYQTKNPDILKLEITVSLPGERYMKFMDYVDSIYKGNNIQIKVHKFAVLYAPLMLYKPEEIDSVFNAGAYSERDIKKRDMAIYAMNEIVSKNPSIELKEAKEAADALLMDEGFLNEENIIPDIQPDIINE